MWDILEVQRNMVINYLKCIIKALHRIRMSIQIFIPNISSHKLNRKLKIIRYYFFFQYFK